MPKLPITYDVRAKQLHISGKQQETIFEGKKKEIKND